MGNKQDKQNQPAPQNTQKVDPQPTNDRSNTQPQVNPQKSGCFGTKKSSSKSKSKGSCFGVAKETSPSKSYISKTNISGKSLQYIHDTKKSTIKVNSIANAKVDDKLFADRENKALLDIKMKRAEPYEILKDSDYFDSQLNDKSDLDKLKKVYESCEIANYKTPQTEKLQTVQIKTYLFDRNLTKIEA